MDAIDILGGLLGGGKSPGGGLGGQILKDLINAGTRGGASAAPQMRKTQAPSSRSGSGSPASLEERARELEELLGVAKGRSQSPAQPAPPTASLSTAATGSATALSRTTGCTAISTPIQRISAKRWN